MFSANHPANSFFIRHLTGSEKGQYLCENCEENWREVEYDIDIYIHRESHLANDMTTELDNHWQWQQSEAWQWHLRCTSFHSSQLSQLRLILVQNWLTIWRISRLRQQAIDDSHYENIDGLITEHLPGSLVASVVQQLCTHTYTPSV